MSAWQERRAEIDRLAEHPPRSANEIRAAVAISWRKHTAVVCWCGGNHSEIGAWLHEMLT